VISPCPQSKFSPQKVFAIFVAGIDNSRGGQMLTQPPLGQNRFLTTKFLNFL